MGYLGAAKVFYVQQLSKIFLETASMMLEKRLLTTIFPSAVWTIKRQYR